MKFETPILFLLFNRLYATQEVFEQIRKIKPKYMFLAADGPRPGIGGDTEKCKQVRDFVTNNIDWECETKTLFQEKNLGCGLAPATAINWFFENVEMGIILEDDCLPEISFFFFCDELLKRFKDNDKVISICGTNVLQNFYDKHSYIFSLYGGNWGWAAWRRSWELYDYEMNSWRNIRNKKLVRKFLHSESEYLGIKKMFDYMILKYRQDIWDIQWFYSRLLYNKLTIVPTKNLVKNIGFGKSATHTFEQDNWLNQLTLDRIDFPLIHNSDIRPNRKFDRANSVKYGWYIKPNYFGKIKSIIHFLIKK